jgi:hydrogenase maturation protease
MMFLKPMDITFKQTATVLTISDNTDDLCVSAARGKFSIIGLGNEFISDDGVGIYAVRQLKSKINDDSRSKNSAPDFLKDIVFEELAIGGLQLLDYIIGYETCVIVDAIVTGAHPIGTIYRFTQTQQQKPVKLATSHQIDLSQVLGLAKLFSADIPHTIRVYGIEVSDVTTFSNSCTALVENAIPQLVELIYHDLFNIKEQLNKATSGAIESNWEIINSQTTEPSQMETL